MDVSIIIVNYNTCDLTLQCLRSIYDKTEDVEFEVFVVDNASVDDSVECVKKEFPQVRIIESSENLGFGRANNLGAKYAEGKYLFLLNSDTILISNIILEFFKFMESHEEYVACGGNLLDVNRKLTFSHGKFPSLLQEFSDIGFARLYLKWYRNHLALGQKASEGDVKNVDYISGADVFIRKWVFDALRGFDPQFFMYYEETDLFFRMRKEGYRACLLPQSQIIHLEGASFDKSNKINLKKSAMQFQSKVLYYRRNMPKGAVSVMKLFALCSATIHFYRLKQHIFSIYKIIIFTK